MVLEVGKSKIKGVLAALEHGGRYELARESKSGSLPLLIKPLMTQGRKEGSYLHYLI
jgi:hypothetical protein